MHDHPSISVEKNNDAPEVRRAQRDFSAELLADLARSGLDAADAAAMQLEDLTPAETFAITGQRRQSYKIPFFTIDGARTDFFRIRFVDQGDPNGFKAVKLQRYWQPAGSAPQNYYPPTIDWLSEFSCKGRRRYGESEKKAFAACKARRPAIGLCGVWSFRAKKTGALVLRDEFDAHNLKGNEAEIIFDSDQRRKPQVLGALHAFARALTTRGARVLTVLLPEDLPGKTVALDDYLLAHGVKAFDALPREKFSEIEALWALNEDYAVLFDPPAILRLGDERLIDVFKFGNLLVADKEIVQINAKGEPKLVSAARAWLKWKCRRVHPVIVYEPGQPEVLEDGSYNKWRRGCEPRHGDVSAFVALVDHLFAGKPKEEREWFLRWCAYPIQHPGTKMFSAVVLFGRTQGSGKSLLGEMLCGVYGEKNSVEIDKHTLGSTFNSWSAEKQFVLANEISDRKDLRLDADSLKNYISRDRVLVNEKYQPAYSVRDCANYLFTSNHQAPIYTDDQDRRYFLLHVEGKLPVEIIKVLRSWKNKPKGNYVNGEGFGPLHQYLLDYDLGDFDPTAAALQTLDREAVVRDSGSDLDRWCADLKADPMPFLRSGSDNFKARDLWRIADLAAVCKIHLNRHVSEKALVSALRTAGFLELGRTRTPFGRLNLWAIGNPDRWRNACEGELAAEYAKGLHVTKLGEVAQP